MTPANTLARLDEIRARNEARIKGITSDDIDALLDLVAWQQGEIKRWRDHYHVLLARESVQQERTAEEATT